MSEVRQVRMGADIGGTFTDIVLEVADQIFSTKILTTYDAPERAIYGEAKPEEAQSLIEDGVPVAPLPFVPSRKTN